MDGFPSDTRKSFKYLKDSIKDRTSTVIFRNIPFGTFSIIAFHDENNNGKFDKTWYGMPKEGVGVPNNPN